MPSIDYHRLARRLWALMWYIEMGHLVESCTWDTFMTFYVVGDYPSKTDLVFELNENFPKKRFLDNC